MKKTGSSRPPKKPPAPAKAQAKLKAKAKSGARKLAAKKAAIAPALRVLPALAPIPLPRRFQAKLAALARRHLFLTLGRGAARVILAVALLLLVQGLIDWNADLPRGVRALLLAADLGGLGWLGWREIVGSWKRRLNLETAALLAQKKWPSTRSAYVAAVQLASGKTGVPVAPALVHQLLQRVEGETARPSLGAAFSALPFLRAAGLGLLGWAVLGTIFHFSPHVSTVLLERIFLSRQPLPTRTVVEPVTRDMAVAIGSDIMLQAKAVGVIPNHGRITLFYAGKETQELAPTPEPDHPEYFSLLLHNVQKPFRYQFSLNDGHGEFYNVKTLIAPSVESVDCLQTYPAYTGLPDQKRTPGDLSLLEGSVLHVHLKATMSLGAATAVYQGIPGQMEMQITGADRKEASADIPIPAKGLTGFSFHLVNQEALASVNDTVYQVQIVLDEPPTVRLIAPEAPQVNVTVKAAPKIVFEVGDDFAVSRLRLCYEIGDPAPSAEDEVPPPVLQTPIDFDLKAIKIAPGSPAVVTYVWDIPSQNPPWREGQVINYWIEAVDNNNVTGPGVTVSNKQHFSIVSPEVVQAQMLKQLQDVTDSMHQMLEKEKKASDILGTPLESNH